MKALFILIVFLLFAFSGKNTCKREGIFRNSTDIKTSGACVLEKNKKGELLLKFNYDFKTQEGPDLDVYLSKGQKVEEGLSVRLDELFKLEGIQIYNLPDSISMSSYNYVVIHCTQYNHWYGYAELGNIIGECSN